MNPVDDLLNHGARHGSQGELTAARAFFERAVALAPHDLRATVNLANLEREEGSHRASSQRYADLLRLLPDHPVIRRNALTGLEYDPQVTDVERLQHASEWGKIKRTPTLDTKRH